MRNLFIIEDSTLVSMMQNQAYVAAFPCLQSGAERLRANKEKPCNTCGRRRQAAKAKDNIFANVRGCIAGLRGAKLNELKRMLDTKRIRLVHLDSRGRSVTLTL